MILIIVLLAVSLVLLAVGFVVFTGLPDSRTRPGKRVRLVLLVSGLFLVGGLAAGVLIKVQEQTGLKTGLSGGVESDARQWMTSHQSSPPSPNQTGDNIGILRDGLSFLKGHHAVGATPEAQRVVRRYGGLPETPTRLLNSAEERQYYDAARAVYGLIAKVAEE